ncbi:Inner membrane protein YqiK [compost metagenome]
MEKQYQVDAEGTRAVNEANNILSSEQVEMQIRLALLKYLPEIIRESVKPMENIDDIKILQVTGLGGIAGNNAQGEGYADQGQISLSDQVVNSALRYRTQAPLIDSLMNELGIQGGDINGLTQSLKPQITSAK